MPTLQTVLTDPEFYNLPKAEQIKVLDSIDPDFGPLPDQEKNQVLSNFKGAFREKTAPTVRGGYESTPMAQSHTPGEGAQYAKSMEMRRAASDIYTPVLQATMGAGGAVLAAGAAAPTGPGAIAAGAAGGTAGYMAATRAARIMDTWLGIRQPATAGQLATETLEDFKTGAAYEAGGQIAGKLIFVPLMKGGQKLYKLVFKKGLANVAATKRAVREKAGKIIDDTSSVRNAEIYARNAEEAAEIERQIPGIKFSLAQRTKDPGLIKLERARTRSPGEGADLFKENEANTVESIRKYYKRNFPDEPGINDLINSLERRKTGIETDIERGITATDDYIETLRPTGPQATGQRLTKRIEIEKGPVQKAMGILEDQIPDYPMTFRNVEGAIYKLSKDPKSSSGTIKTIENFKAKFDGIVEKGQSTFRAFGVRRTINEEINKAYARDNESAAAALLEVKAALEKDLAEVSQLARSGKIARSGDKIIDTDRLSAEYERGAKKLAKTRAQDMAPDYDTMIEQLNSKQMPTMKIKGEGDQEYFKRLERDYKRVIKPEIPQKIQFERMEEITGLRQRLSDIQDILRTAEPGKDVAAAMEAYNQFASTDYFRRFGGSQLQRAGAKGIRTENIPGYFDSPTGADELISAIGKQNAKDIMKGHYAYDLMRYAGDDATGQIVSRKMDRWLKNKNEVLKKYGLVNEFKRAELNQRTVDQARAVAKDFERGSVKRILEADPERAAERAIYGSNPAKETRRLLRIVQGDPAALKGLQNAFAENMISKVSTTARTIRGDATMSNAKFSNLLKKYNAVAKVIYSNTPRKFQALKNMQRAYEIAIRNQSSPLGGGSDTAENLMTELRKTPLLSRTASVLKAIVNTIIKRRDKKVNEILTRALFDPDLAAVLEGAAKGKYTPERFDRLLNFYVGHAAGASARISQEPEATARDAAGALSDRFGI